MHPSLSLLPEFAAAPTLPTLEEHREQLVGQRFGSFVARRVLGSGGMGTVLLAEHPLIPKRVAIKVLHPHLAARPELVARFLSEARALSLVQHEHVVTVFDLGSSQGLPYFVMEYLEGPSLADQVRAHGPLPPVRAVELLSQVCAALSAVHERGLVHCDLKPANLLLAPTPQGPPHLKLLDFGIARLAVRSSGLEPSGPAPGTPSFMAPEQCMGRPVDARTDLYAVGVLGYLLLSGRLPLSGHRPEQVLAARLAQEPPALHRVCPGVPEALSAVLQRAMAVSPEQRYASAAELRTALQAALAPPPAPPLAARLQGHGGPPLPCERVGRTGLFLHTQGPLPPLLGDISLTLLLPGGELPCTGQVVHHVSPAQARASGQPAGFGVQLRVPGPSFHEQLERLLSSPQAPEQEDMQAELVLHPLQGRLATGEHYACLGLPRDAEPAAIRARARELREQLEALRTRPLSGRQRWRLERALERVAQALRILGHLERRAEYDAELRNPAGILRCLAAGLTATALEACRQRFLERHPTPQGHVLLHLASGDAFASAGRYEEALEAYTAALRVDPLHLEALKRWYRLRRRGGAAPAHRR